MSNPLIVPIKDKDGNHFEAFELRSEAFPERKLYIDVNLANAVGGIEKVRRAIMPWHMIVSTELF